MTNFEFVSDFPFGEIFPDLLLWVPNLIVISSLRDPMIWAKRRLEEHGNTPICHPSLWNHALVYHPFDIIACLSLREYTNEALVPISFLKNIDQLIAAYVKYNTFNFVFATSQNLAYHTICLWDPEITGDNGQMALTEIWKLYPQTQSFLKRIHEPFVAEKNKPTWIPNGALPRMKQLFQTKYEMELSTGGSEEAPPSPIVLPVTKSKLLNSDSFNQSLSARVIIIAPRLSDLLLFHTFLCPDNSPQPCRLLRDSLSSLPISQLSHTNLVLTMSQRWYQKLFSCFSNPSLPCQTSSLLNSYSVVVESLSSSSPYLLLSLSTVDHLPSLLPFLFSPYSAASPPPLILTLHYPLHVISSVISRNKHILVCRPSLWDHPNLVHPFDVVTCLQLMPSISASLVTISSLSSLQIQKIMNRYYNSYNHLLSHSLDSTRISVNILSLSDESVMPNSTCTISHHSYRSHLQRSILSKFEDALSPVNASRTLSLGDHAMLLQNPLQYFSFYLFLGILFFLFIPRRNNFNKRKVVFGE